MPAHAVVVRAAARAAAMVKVRMMGASLPGGTAAGAGASLISAEVAKPRNLARVNTGAGAAVLVAMLPLRNRLANAPPLFVGRRREVAWLKRELRDNPVVVVSGPGGIGKTALVLHTLHRS